MARKKSHAVFEIPTWRMDASRLRISNERAVLVSVATTPGSSAAEVARTTGLGPQSVGRILTDLEEAGLVVRGEARRGQRGQPAVPMYLNPGGVFSLGCEIGWRHLHILIRNLTGDILGEHWRDYAFPDAHTIMEEVGSLSRLLTGLVPADERHRILGLGLAMPSGIGRNIDLVGGSPEQAALWRAMDVQAAAEAATGLRVFRFNDGNAGAWAELAAHPVPRPANLAYIQVGTFIGAGLIVEGRLWEGPTGNSANLGSMIIRGDDGLPKFVHLLASLYALEKRLAAAGMQVPSGNPATWNWKALEPIASDWLQDAAAALATTVVNAHALAEFSVVLIDGVMPRPVVERLVDLVRNAVAALPVLTADPPSIEVGRLGRSAAARGAALKPIFRSFFSRASSDLR